MMARARVNSLEEIMGDHLAKPEPAARRGRVNSLEEIMDELIKGKKKC